MVKPGKIHALFLCFVFLIAGCSFKDSMKETYGPTAHQPYQGELFQIAELAAMKIAYSSIYQALPKESIMEIDDNNKKGFLVIQEVATTQDSRYAIYQEQIYSYAVIVVPKQGMTADGQLVTGYTFETKGEGDYSEGDSILRQIEQNLDVILKQNASSVAVGNMQPGQHAPPSQGEWQPKSTYQSKTPEYTKPLTPSETAGSTPVPTTQAAPSSSPPQPGNAPPQNSFDKLRMLKELHEEGVITDEDFESKKKDLLDRI